MLCTWIRSIFAFFTRANEVSTCWRAAAGSALLAPRDATFSLVAQNTLSAMPSSLTIFPDASSEAP